jgi:hypothetical protein
VSIIVDDCVATLLILLVNSFLKLHQIFRSQIRQDRFDVSNSTHVESLGVTTTKDKNPPEHLCSGGLRIFYLEVTKLFLRRVFIVLLDRFISGVEGVLQGDEVFAGLERIENRLFGLELFR